jgi:hypothetical protein
MNKLAFTLATVAALGLSTAAFPQTSTTAPSPKAAQSMQPRAQATQHVKQPQAQATKHVKKRHHAAANKVVQKQGSSMHRHSASQKGKKVVNKHVPANKSVRTKAAS